MAVSKFLRVALVLKELVKAGYTNVWNLDGGMAAWEQQGLPLKERRD